MSVFSPANQAINGALQQALQSLKQSVFQLQQSFKSIFANSAFGVADVAAAAGPGGVTLLSLFVAQLSSVVSLATLTSYPLPTLPFSLTPSDATATPASYTLVIISGNGVSNAGTYTLTPNYSTGVVTVS